MNTIRFKLVLIAFLIIYTSLIFSCTNLFFERDEIYVKENLIEIYRLQKSYHKIHGTYSNSLDDLYFLKKKSKKYMDMYDFEIYYADSNSFVVKSRCNINSKSDYNCKTWQINEDKEIKRILNN